MMNKTSFYVTLLLCSLGLGKETTVYASSQYSQTNQNTSESYSSNKDYPFLSLNKERLNLYSSNFPKNDHRIITLEFRDKIKDIIVQSDDLRVQIHKAKIMGEKVRTLEKKLQENNALLDKQQEILSKYEDASRKDILQNLNERKAQYEQQMEASSKEDDTQKEMLATYLSQVTEQIRILSIPEGQIRDENSANDTLILQYANNSKNDPAETLKDLNKTYNNLIDLKLKTVYDLPEPFKDGNLVSPYQILWVMDKMGIEKDTLDAIHPERFARFSSRCLELPNPQMEETSSVTGSYLSHIDGLIRLYGIRLREDVFNFHYFSAIHDLIGEQSPYEEGERAITAKVMNTMKERESSHGREAFTRIFKDLGYNPEDNNLMELLNKAIPNHSLGLIQVLSAGLNNYDGFSFKLDDEVPLPVRAAEKIIKKDNNINEEFYGCRNRVVRDKFNLDVLQVIRENFTKYASSTVSSKGYDSDEDTIF